MLLEERAPAEAALAPAASRWPRPRPGGLQVKLAVLALLQAAGSVTGTALPSCPGHYCGRDTAEVGQWGAAAQCGACPRGSRTDGAVCVPCTAAVTPFSALYLAATMAVLIVWHAAFVLSRDDGHRPKLLVIGTVTLETVLAAVFAVLALAPAGELRLFGCPIQDLSDFYPYLHNPRIDCAATLHCASEAAFPLTTWVLVVNALCVPLAVLGRGVLMYTRPDVRGLALASLAATLYALPVHAFLHMVVGGLFYYSYPVLLFLVALVVAVRELANAAAEDRNVKPLRWRISVLVMTGLLMACGMGTFLILLDVFRAEYWALLLTGPLVPILLFKATEPWTRARRVRNLWLAAQVADS